MIYLTTTTDLIEVVTSAAVAVDVNVNYIDADSATLAPSGAGRQNTAISTATTTTVLSSPAASVVRTLKQMTVANKNGTTAVDVTVQFDQGGTNYTIIATTLQPLSELIYIEGLGFNVYTGSTVNGMLTSTESDFTQRILRPSPAHHGNLHTFLMISGTAYYTYIGRVARDTTIKFLELQVTGAGAGAQTAEVGLYSTPLPPNKSGQTLTRIVATGTVDSLTTTGVKRNTASFAQLVTAGTHIWAAFRTAMATTQPTVNGASGDMGQGAVLTTTGGGALTAVATAVGTIPAVGTVTTHPYMALTLD